MRPVGEWPEKQSAKGTSAWVQHVNWRCSDGGYRKVEEKMSLKPKDSQVAV